MTRSMLFLVAFGAAGFSPHLMSEPPTLDPERARLVSDKVQSKLASRLGAGDTEAVRVVVSLDAGDEPIRAARGGRSHWRQRAHSIAAVQDRVLGAFSRSGRALERARRYRTLPGFSAELSPDQIEALAARDDVLYVEEMPKHTIFDDQSFPLTDVDLVHNTGAGGAGTVIAIIDDGIDHDLPDFAGRYLGGYDFADDDDDPSNDCPSQSHGTSVAGVALGASTGVAPLAEFVFLKIQSSSICGSSSLNGDLIGAIDWAVANKETYGIDIISISLGGGNYSSEAACDGSSSMYFNAIRNAVDAGITVIAASGNDGLCDAVSRPACFSDVISVGAAYDEAMGTFGWCVSSNTCAATTSGYNCGSGRTAAFEATAADNVIVYSNSASFLDLVAPSTCAATVTPGGNPESCFGGTSSATPFTSGVAALAVESAGKGALMPADLRALLTDTGHTVIDPKNGRVSPRVNGWTAVVQAPDYASGGPTNEPPIASFLVNCSGLSCDFDADGSSDSDGAIDTYAWNFGDGADGNGVSPSHTYTQDGDYSVTLTVTDNDGAPANTSQVVSVSAPVPNSPPTASFTLSCSGLTCDFDAAGSSDVDGAVVAYAWRYGDGDEGSGASASHSYAEAGDYSVTLTVTDDDGATAETSQVARVAAPPSVGPKLHVGRVGDVASTSWTTVDLPNSYASMIVIASPNYSAIDRPAVVRIRNAAGSRFEVKVQNPSGATVSGVDVHFLVVEEGAFTAAADGITMEAVRFSSILTDHKGSLVGEARSYVNGYTNPVVLGQVMTYNDPGWSVFWARGGSRTSPPSSSALWVGKHVGEDSDAARAAETIGYIVVEAGSGALDGIAYSAALGGDIVRGMDNAPPFSCPLTIPASPTFAVAAAAALDGGDGGWPVLYGTTPVSADSLALGFDEDQVGDTERSHTTEQVAYMAFAAAGDNQAPNAGFTHDCAGLDCSFTDTSTDSDGTIDSRSWDFGDRMGRSTEQEPSYRYAANGTYRVTLTVTDDAGARHSAAADVAVTAPPSGDWIELTYDDFETGWGSWRDGGSDAQLTASFAIGSRALNLQDDSTTSESELAESLDLSAYSQLKIEFSYVVQSFERDEDFWVRYSADGGASWQTVQGFVNDVDFVDDGTRYNPVITIDSTTFAFTDNVLIKLECDASGNRDDVYIDNIGIFAK